VSGALKPIGIAGAGSWGTALAISFARNGRAVRLWSVDRSELDPLPQDRENKRFLPGCPFPDPLGVEFELPKLVADCDDILVVVPSHGFRSTLKLIADCKPKALRLAWATKGFEIESGKLLHEVAKETLGAKVPFAVLSGPTFAKEVARGMPTAVTIAASDKRFAEDLAQAIASPVFRAYTSDDLTGVEVGGTVKNIIAIGCGISDGLGFGANARAALITRGLAEITRLGLKLGARPETFQGLTGLGDLVLTCTGDLSRNRTLGMRVAEGADPAAYLAGQRSVAEGFSTAAAAYDLARKVGVDMPVTEQVYHVLHRGRPLLDAVRQLLERGYKEELQGIRGS
jgi:glycerol-3-phosphate dehydrogenase (NAD(P)+)